MQDINNAQYCGIKLKYLLDFRKTILLKKSYEIESLSGICKPSFSRPIHTAVTNNATTETAE